ncbi:Vacuolar protein-sorting-associated protein 46 [Neolecta irregularis DAH-3]|uniref:Vacuolar protein-sorting-associated protein 46 n=1 Tax=Neolecta irregularis (strain DAH-3) TaxID=1198029 RepID=A0A1U7LHK1_NEOID|nr:Vacuolar protein-sorting-associated protein 46 [Neolecta irregularis DAH-3]|eukprot:OLL22135.1 Vacuolar protein-sorting-associated protein 46 [Neolecta irregularis DAH-3]
MSGLEKTLFNLKARLYLLPVSNHQQFSAKQLNKQAKRAEREANQRKTKLKDAIQKGNRDIAELHASEIIRKQTEHIDLLRLSARLDAVASRVQTAVTMRNVNSFWSPCSPHQGLWEHEDGRYEHEPCSGNYGFDKGRHITFLEFETQFEDLDVTSSYMQNSIGQSTATGTPQDKVDALMQEVAVEAGIEFDQELGSANASKAKIAVKKDKERDEENLDERLRALRS